jgi:transposase
MTSKGAEKMKHDTIGVDVSKDHLDAYRLNDGESRRFNNDRTGHKAFVKWLAQTPVDRVVFEPTGPYHRAFERTAREWRALLTPRSIPVRRAALPRLSARSQRPIGPPKPLDQYGYFKSRGCP